MLTVVKGDIFEFCVVMCNVDPYAVKKVEFSSRDLGLIHEAFYDDGVYRVRIHGEVTKNFPVGFAKYDVTVTLIDDERLTVKVNERVQVLEKRNEV